MIVILVNEKYRYIYIFKVTVPVVLLKKKIVPKKNCPQEQNQGQKNTGQNIGQFFLFDTYQTSQCNISE